MAWDQISPQTIRRSWQKLIPIDDDSAGQEDLPSNTELADRFQSLGYEIEEDVQNWIDSDDPGYEHLSNEQIVEQVQQSHTAYDGASESEEEDDTTESPPCPISNAEAIIMLDKSLTWLQH